MWVKRRQQSGFTIVELLIVVVVIAILATITIVAYNNIQNRARASSVSSALGQASKKLALYKIDNGSYPASLSTVGVSNTSDVDFQYKITSSGYCITATNGNVSYKITEDSNPASGGCSGHGQGGVAAITNLSPNPSFENDSNGLSFTTSLTTLVRDPSNGVEGIASLKATRSGAGDAYFLMNFTTPVAVAPSTPYTLSFWIWADSTVTLISSMEFRRNSSTGLDKLSVMNPSPITSTPKRVVMSGTTTASASTGGLQFAGRLPGTIGASVYFDGFMVTEGSTAYTYADGNSANWDWDGTANNSISTGPPL